MINRLGDSLDFQSQALTLRSERQRLLASNIANADTPGYVARDMDFASALREATGTALGRHAGAAGAAHEPGHTVRRLAGRDRTCAMPRRSQSNLDGNSVDMDRERASFADNSRQVRGHAALHQFAGAHHAGCDEVAPARLNGPAVPDRRLP